MVHYLLKLHSIGILKGWRWHSLLALLCLVSFSTQVMAQMVDLEVSSKKLKKLSLEELMNIEVTSISNRPERLAEVASAVQVITGDDIRRSGAIRLPKSLQLASNLQIAQSNSHDWAITARGFNGLPSAGGILANKLLVMIDGRSIYNPLFGGVYWDVQNIVMEDLDRIEVVSGPGGTLWGANAVNGVINIVSKSAKETQGVYLSGATGNLLNDYTAMRVGQRSKLDTNLYFRLYVQHFSQGSTELLNGASAKDRWKMRQGGFRLDYYPSESDIFTFQGDAYTGESNLDSALRYAQTNGQNLLGRYTHVFSSQSDFQFQVFFDRNFRETPTSTSGFFYALNTFDFDAQHRFPIAKKHSILYGLAYRWMGDASTQSFDPRKRIMPLYSGFIQDEINVVPDKFKLIYGSKILHNVYTGFELQPSIRAAYTPRDRNTVWAAISRSVRTPSRFDADIALLGNRLAPFGFKSEKVFAYELGYRFQPLDNLNFSVATYFNHYDDVRSLNTDTNKYTPTIIANSQKAESYGLEIFGNYKASDAWRLRGGYTFFNRSIWSTEDNVLPISVEFESVDPNHVFMLQSIVDLKKNVSFDVVGRYVSLLPRIDHANPPDPGTPAYFTFDVHLAKKIKLFEISLVGQNLASDRHSEVGNSRIPRTFHARFKCRF